MRIELISKKPIPSPGTFSANPNDHYQFERSIFACGFKANGVDFRAKGDAVHAVNFVSSLKLSHEIEIVKMTVIYKEDTTKQLREVREHLEINGFASADWRTLAAYGGLNYECVREFLFENGSIYALGVGMRNSRGFTYYGRTYSSSGMGVLPGEKTAMGFCFDYSPYGRFKKPGEEDSQYLLVHRLLPNS